MNHAKEDIKIVIIGGSGLYEMKGMEVVGERRALNPYGEPSNYFTVGNLSGVPVAFLARHGKGHRLLPSEINYRANIYAAKQIGAQFILSVSAVGSLKEEIVPGDLVLVDQFIDRTQNRPSSFFGEGLVAHVPFANPVCKLLKQELWNATQEIGAKTHDKGTYICMEGPMFSTKAESNLYRSWGADVIGMTNYQEAKLAREAGLSYATLALSTDYDCWHPDHDSVTTEMIIQTLNKNVAMAQSVLAAVVPKVAKHEKSPYAGILKNAILTSKESIPKKTQERLKIFFG